MPATSRDRLGSITGLTSSTGALTDSYRYDPWGGNLASSGSSGNPLRYIGGYLDTSSGLYLLGQRYYQPSAGRFTQLDPHPKQLLSVNRYAYSGCNPVNYSDPSGLDANIGAACVAGALSALATAALIFTITVALSVGIAAFLAALAAVSLPELLVGIVALAIAGCVGGITYEVIYDLLT